MLGSCIVRRLHVTTHIWQSQTSVLATLRKKTGYTFSNCKKALEVNNNDLQKAETWLKEQAQVMGWSKATKLQGRQTSQGLVGVLSRNNIVAMVELNCETDFVARNQHFHAMVDRVAKACMNVAAGQELQSSLMQIQFDSKALTTLEDDGKSLADQLALMIGTVGENATLRRAVCYKADDSLHLSSYAHPSGIAKGDTLLGKFAGIVAITNTNENVADVAKKICQHVVGMKPTKIGTDDDVPAENVDEEQCLIHQEYLLDDNLLVNDLLKANNVQVVNFNRFECGEEISPYPAQSLDTVETCQ